MASYWEETDDILQSRHLEERLNQMSKKCRNCQKCWGVLVCFNAFQKWKKKIGDSQFWHVTVWKIRNILRHCFNSQRKSKSKKKKNPEQAVALVGSFNAEAFLKTFSFLLLMVILLSIIFSV